MDRYIVVKIMRPTDAEFESYKNATNYRRTDTGYELTGSVFRGDLTIAALASEYGLELVCRVLRAACVPFSLEQGRKITRRNRKCGPSTQSQLQMVSLMSELVTTPTEDCESTTAESATLPEEEPGQPTGD